MTSKHADRDRASNQAIVESALSRYKELFGLQDEDFNESKRRIAEAKDEELRVIAGAITDDPKGFVGSLIKDLTLEGGLSTTATIAVLYSKDIHPGRSLHFRARSIKHAYFAFVTFNDAKNNSDDMMDDKDLWNLCFEDEETKARAKRFTEMACADPNNLALADFEVKLKLMQLMTDDTRTDHDAIIEFLRTNGLSGLTMEQLNFFLDGGPAALHGGAL